MILLSLTTQCFKKLGDYTTTFTDGLNIISGDNAHGKSTLLQAIGFALYGNEAVSGIEADIRTWGETRSYSAELTFTEGGHTYVVTRTKTSAKVTRDGELVANGKTECTKFITTLFTLNWKDFKTFVLSKQFDTFAVLEEGATTLNRKVEERAGITLIDKVQSLARGKAREIEVEAARLEYAVEGLDTEVAEEAELQERVAALKAELAELKEIKPVEPELAVPEEPELRPALLTEKKAAHEQAQRRVETATTALSRAKDTLAQVSVDSDVEAAYGDLSEVEESIATYEERLEVFLMPELQVANSALARKKEAQGGLERIEKAIMAVYEQAGDDSAQASAITASETAVSSIQRELKVANERSWEVDAQIKAITAAVSGGVCPTCNRTYDDHADLDVAAETIRREALEAERIELSQFISALTSKLNDRQAALRNQWAQLDRFNSLQEDHTRLSAEVAQITVEPSKVEDLQKEIDGVRRSLKACEQIKLDAKNAMANAVKQENLRKHCEAGVTTALADLATAEAELEATEVVTEEQITAATLAWVEWKDAMASVDKQREEYRQRASVWASESTAAETALQYATKELETQAAHITALREKVTEWERLTKRASTCKRLATFLAERRASYLRDVWNQIMAVASAYINAATNGLITAVSYEDGTFFYEENELRPNVSSASGAQLAFIGISIRIGLSRVLYGDKSLLIFDEPTESMSEANAASVVGALATSAKQVIVITHKTSDQELAKNVIEL